MIYGCVAEATCRAMPGARRGGGQEHCRSAQSCFGMWPLSYSLIPNSRKAFQ